jgi:hypothetical protein
MPLSHSVATTQPRLGPVPVTPREALPSRATQTIAMPCRMPAAVEGALAAAVLAPTTLLIHGYHPFAEDGGLYVSAILKALHPSLYPTWSQFVTVQMRYSLFAPLLASVIRFSGLRVSMVVFLLHVLSIWATLFGGWLVAARCYASRQARWGAISLLALWLTLPIAGTSLLLMDPYLTARSVSTPCGLFALASTLDVAAALHRTGSIPWRSVAGGLFALAIAFAVHPLMAGFNVCCLVLLLACSLRRPGARAACIAALCLMGVASAACLYWFGPAATPNYFQAEHTREYWFLQNWHWYEIAGLCAPLLVLAFLTRRGMRRSREASRWLSDMAFTAGLTALAISLLFVRTTSLSYEVARMQPLRIYHTIYIVMILVAGAVAGERLFARHSWRSAASFLVLGTLMFYVQRCTFPASGQVELPWRPPQNGWEQAFAWIRAKTPRNALFALDAHYITDRGEDAHYFRAVARRSALADFSKDGGLAAIDPGLADSWARAQAAQTNLDTESDAQRIARLRPFGVSWIVLPAAATTHFACPYRNLAAKVCRLGAARN